ncbi:glycosyltransferase [Halomonas campisalis]|uniref:Glycosyltransferase n=1 Tax=Billgrantia campisalis TaxID=74661 RepID=A0ABS9P8E3_9GAMM|nr:glycosyltransferase [Halomonas campisalis]MCG6658029.1 glycosyltransferase [Halomonas campisalis]MDR5862696.1 glycosyltransferase [Halomonas campisalis]
MTTCYLVDNPAGRPLAEDPGWLDALKASPGDSGILIGFSHADLITIRQRLEDQLPPSALLSVDEAALDALGGAESELARLALERAIEGLCPETLECHGHAGQRLRFGMQASVAEPQTAAVEPDRRPRLAFVSPLPPQPTGIADYSAELLPYLAEHYEITLVVDQPSVEERLAERYAVIETADFAKRAREFDRVLYQVGNSLYHAYQFPLLRRHPGSVVLHDVYLFDAVWWMQESQAWPDGLAQQLFSDHGYPASLALHQRDPEKEPLPRGPEDYPVNGFVTQEAAGLIVHSAFARDLDRHWRPDAERAPAAVIPHLRQLPDEITPALKRQARQALGVAENTCLIASFGGINPKKLSDRLVEAILDTPLGEHPDIQLVLVGAQHGGEFGRRLERRLRGHPRVGRVTITGFVDRERYLRWLQAADIAVQLRQHSRGESSGAIFDAMAHGVAVVANAHGSSAELPESAVAMLPEQCDLNALSESLVALVDDPQRRQALGQAARGFVAEALAPPRIATRYREAIEGFARGTRRQRAEQWLDRLAACQALRELDEPRLKSATRTLCELDTLAPAQPPRILFDVSTIAWHDLKTGIERVTRRLADELLRHPPPGWRVELIRWGGDDFHLARGFASDQLGIAPPAPDRPCEARPGDIYVSVEWAPPLLEQAGHALERLRARGVRCYFTVHDLLPLRLPHCFPDDTPARMRAWFEAIAGLADGITTVSATVADDVRGELEALALPHPPWVRHFHLGADFSGHAAGEPLQRGEQRLLEKIGQASGATLLVVGTVEPRKGHRQVMEAMERCWQDGAELNLVIVGKQGWDVDDLMQRIARHPRRDRRLFWVEGASDTLLRRLYAGSDGLVAASLGEGFGLPLIEAAHHGIPILARDIPVFREVAGEHADYFTAETAEDLAQALTAWQRRWRAGELGDSRAMPYQSWAQSAGQWLGHILAEQPTPAAPGQPQGENGSC